MELINDLREAIFAIALPTPPAPITSAFIERPFIHVTIDGYLEPMLAKAP
jgi:hypothetical protein